MVGREASDTRVLDDRKALAAFAAAAGEDLAAASGGFAGSETDFAGAF